MSVTSGDIVQIDGRLFRLHEFKPTVLGVSAEIPDDKFDALGERHNLPDLSADAPADERAVEDVCKHFDVPPPAADGMPDAEADQEAEEEDPEPTEPLEDVSLAARLARFQEISGMDDNALAAAIGISPPTLGSLRSGTARDKTRSKAEMFLGKNLIGKNLVKMPATDPGICLRQVVGGHLKENDIPVSEAADYFGIREASFLAIMNSGPPPLEDTLWRLAEKIPEVAGAIDDLIKVREEWEQSRKGGT